MRGGGGGGGGKEYKKDEKEMRGEEGVCGGGRDTERKRTYERQEAPVRAPVTEEAPAFYHRLLPSFFHPSLLSGNRRDTQRGKSGCLKFLLPSCVHLLS